MADFLQDEETLISATRAANAVLIDNSRKRSATCMEGMESRSMVELASQHVEELLSLHDLQPQLALSILRVNTHRLQKSEMLYFWLRRLPACCRPLIVAAVVEHSYLEVSMMHATIHAMCTPKYCTNTLVRFMPVRHAHTCACMYESHVFQFLLKVEGRRWTTTSAFQTQQGSSE